MRKIYLASDSKARKQLLNILGLEFKVLPSKVNELKSRGRSTYAELVKANAVNKALDVAGRVKDGIIIAADTIVVQNGRIFGKPKDLFDAKKMLKRLTSKPQWLYTGIAVIDKDKSRTLTACEKTKIYMDKLTDAEIDSYFRQVSPLDKAGSFDIQGKGAFFIRRIEGCFYNVVGLPLRRLYLMLKDLDVKIFMFCTVSFMFCSVLSGCSTEYNIVTNEQESYIYSTDREVAMGKSIADAVAQEYKLVNDPLVEERVEKIGKKIAVVCDRKDIDYHFYVLDEDEVNAVSLPGGYVYIFKGLVDKVSSDDELAGVVAHEVGHIVARHSIKRLQADQAYSLLRLLVSQAPGTTGGMGAAADAAFTELLLGYSREDELLADQLGARYSKLAGYDPHGMIKFMNKLQEIQRHKPLQPRTYYKTHPYVPDRIRVIKQELGEGIGFDDYINIEQKSH
ncbi:MAG: Maf and M48 domain-containing protein [Candidatus Omnitrophica bacterium]|nr:Maf and M48 domain-containing protein [Candidatus Omnitrophota bacterium]